MMWILGNYITPAQLRQHSEDALMEKFDVNWILYHYDGKHIDDYPGSITRYYHPADGHKDRPTYGNCRRCHLMGPMGNQCSACGPHLHFLSTYVIILAEQQLCDPRERWYNPEFLHNTNGSSRIVDEPDEIRRRLPRKRLCEFNRRQRPYPTMTGLNACGRPDFKENMRIIYTHPLIDARPDRALHRFENDRQVQLRARNHVVP
jgi:hypothetical protein